VGRNVVARMTGGLADILDEDDTLVPKVRAKPVLVLVLISPNYQLASLFYT